MDPVYSLGSKAQGAATVSVILIVRNGAKFIAQALQSIFQSTLQPIEILVVDGNSADDTIAIAESFPLVRIQRQTSKGIADAYNEGIRLAKGQYLAFISHDDIWMPGKLDLQIAHLENCAETDAVLCQVEHFLEAGQECPPGFRAELLNVSRPGWIMEALVARAEVFDRVGGFDPSFAVSEDSDWFARALDAGIRDSIARNVGAQTRLWRKCHLDRNPDQSSVIKSFAKLYPKKEKRGR